MQHVRTAKVWHPIRSSVLTIYENWEVWMLPVVMSVPPSCSNTQNLVEHYGVYAATFLTTLPTRYCCRGTGYRYHMMTGNKIIMLTMQRETTTRGSQLNVRRAGTGWW